MLNIARIGPGGEDYYLAQVVSAEDYYVERGEAPGRWDGALARELELHGRVEADELKAVLAGRHPETGELLASHPARKVTGFDLAFRAPKSVSLAWGLAEDPEVAEQVREAHRSAVREALSYLEREVGFTRRGAGGAERVAGTGLAAAAFQHRTSREGDPLLHTHVVVANLIHTADDGVWRTVDSRGLYRHAKTAGVLYQTQLRHELTTRLGLAWQPVTNGHADLEGFDRELIEAFSRRRAQIVERLDELGFDSPEAAQIATYATRRPKDLQGPEVELREQWADRSRQLGFAPSRVTELLRQVPAERWDLLVDTDALEELGELLAGEEGLTARSATFARRDAVQAVAAALPAGGTVAEVEALTDQLLADGRLVTVGRGTQLSLLARTPTDVDDPVRYTTTDLLATETIAIERALARSNEQVATVDTPWVDWVVRRHGELGDDQAAMVRQLCTSGAGVEVVVGNAGSGKTHALKIAHDIWQAEGLRVVGCSLAARAARGLEDASGIASSTLHRLLAACDDPTPGSPLPPGGVVVVDEAGMVGTRQLARLLAHGEDQGTKVVLVGDPAQLAEIDAGGLFRGLCHRLPTIELSENRRQHAGWERAVVVQLRQGQTRQAVAGYAEHGRLTVTGPDELAGRVLDDWQQLAEQDGPESVVMIARTRNQVDHLNYAARQRRINAGQISGPEVRTSDGRRFAAGDRVVCLRNDRRLDIDNGTRATVVGVHPFGALNLRLDGHDHDITLPASYIAEGNLDHGYAVTGHKAQGLTVDHALVVVDETIDGEWGYVAMSRGRHTNHLYLADNDRADPRRHAPEPAEDPTDALARRLAVSRADTPLADRDIYDPTETAVRWQQLAHRLHDAREVDHQRRRLQHQLDDLVEQLETLRAYYARDHAKLDEHTSGLSRLSKTSRRERDRLNTAVQRYIDQAHRIEEQTGGIRRQLAQLTDQPDIAAWQAEADRLRDVLDAVAADNLRRHEKQPPEWLVDLLGTPPERPDVHAIWREAATGIEAFRIRWQIDDPDHALGPPPVSDTQNRDRAELVSHLRAAVRQITRHVEPPERERGLVRQRSISRGISR
ncbi:MAG: relaxase domain-containing protein [Actinomycetota bacterium]|nr:relaxase domain-containing protein [Actinomycetota bacterium]